MMTATPINDKQHSPLIIAADSFIYSLLAADVDSSQHQPLSIEEALASIQHHLDSTTEVKA
jgi:hypothetical protein